MQGRMKAVRSLILGTVSSALLAVAGGAHAGTLDEVRARDSLICGVSEGLPGFSDKTDAGEWVGFDVDFCRAVAAASLGDPAKVTFVPLSANQRFEALKNGEIDLLSRNSTWTMSRDLELGVDFAGVIYYDGQGFLVRVLNGMTSALELYGARICVVTGTTTRENAERFFERENMPAAFQEFADRDEARAAYEDGQCDAYTADSSALASERSRLAVPDDHVVLRDVISKEPLGPVTREDDLAWTELVRWTLFGLINAEELELTAEMLSGDQGAELATSLGAPAARDFGLEPDWLGKVVASVGNYGEIFDRNLGEETPLAIRRGVNALWTRGGILYAPPMQ